LLTKDKAAIMHGLHRCRRRISVQIRCHHSDHQSLIRLGHGPATTVKVIKTTIKT
jgi:hypothetical protein